MRVLIISGPSGVGKSSIAKMLVSRYPEKYAVVKSVTTRKPREDERLEEYTYLSEDSFRILERAGNFLETTCYSGNGNLYATPRDEVTRILKQNKMPVLVIDVAGRKQVCSKAKEYGFEVTSVFIIASAEQVCKRLLMTMFASPLSRLKQFSLESVIPWKEFHCRDIWQMCQRSSNDLIIKTR